MGLQMGPVSGDGSGTEEDKRQDAAVPVRAPSLLMSRILATVCGIVALPIVLVFELVLWVIILCAIWVDE